MKKKLGFLWMTFLSLMFCFMAYGMKAEAATTLKLGERDYLQVYREGEPTYRPSGGVSRTYIWSISNKDVLEQVDKDGKYFTVRAVGVGTATVSCKIAMRYQYYDSRRGQYLTGYDEEFGGSWTYNVERASSNSSNKPSNNSGSSSNSSSSSSSTAPTRIEINSVELDMPKGNKYQLKASVYPSKAKTKVTWSSSNKKVAKVSSTGKVTAVGKGTATIYAKTSNGKVDSCKVNVHLKVSKLKLNKSKLTLNAGKNYSLKCTVSPKGATTTLKWSSSNTKVATVDSKGKVTAKGKGTATITVKASNGKKATCKVTVKIVPSGIKLDKTSEIMYKGATTKLKASILPAGASAKVKWKSSKSSVVSVDSKGKLKAKKTGSATITATMNGKKATCKVKVYNKPKAIKLSATSLTLPYSEYQYDQITYKLEPANSYGKVTWSSSDPSAVRVEQDGCIYPQRPNSSAVITANVAGIVKATCKVTITEPRIENIDISGMKTWDTNEMQIGDTVQVTAILEPEGILGKPTWKSSDSSVVSVSSTGLVKALKAGKAQISVSYKEKTEILDVVVYGGQTLDVSKGAIVVNADAGTIQQGSGAVQKYNPSVPIILSGSRGTTFTLMNLSVNQKIKIILLDTNMQGIDLSRVQRGSVELVSEGYCSWIGANWLQYNLKLPVNGAAPVTISGEAALNISGKSPVVGGLYNVGNFTIAAGTDVRVDCKDKNAPAIGCEGSYSCSNIRIASGGGLRIYDGSKAIGSASGLESNISGEVNWIPR